MTTKFGFVFSIALMTCKGVTSQCPFVNLTLIPGPDRGLIQVTQNSSSFTVCDTYFSNKAAADVCRYLNLPTENAYRIHASEFQERSSSTSLRLRVKCDIGQEATPCECGDVTNHDVRPTSCTQRSVVAIVCTRDPVVATWKYKDHWLGSDVNTVNVSEGDDISCAAINGTARYLSVRIHVPGETRDLVRKGVGTRTLHNIQKSHTGRLDCSVSNGVNKDQSTNSIQLNVIPKDTISEKESSTPAYIFIVSAVGVVAVAVVGIVVAVYIRRRSRQSNYGIERPVLNNQQHHGRRGPLPPRPTQSTSTASSGGDSTYFIAVDINMGNNYDTIQ